MTSVYSRLRLKKRTSINSHSHFHKEKEMADFRKWLFAFAVVALLLGGSMANAQLNSGVSCSVQNSTPVIVRSEGITELVGDIVLACTGGIPTAVGTAVPVTNVTLTLNTNITSRLLGGGFIDALLLIDEPYPAAPHITTGTGNGSTPANQPTQKVCFSNGTPISPTVGPPATPGSCNYLAGTGGGGYETATDPYLGATAYTVYVAQQSAANQVTWLGVPIDPPGSNGSTRYLRITNVRANACQLGLSSTLIPTQIVGFIAINPSQNIAITNPQVAVAYIQQGLITGVTAGGEAQCNDTNTGFFSNGTGIAEAAVTVKEGFADAFKRGVWTGINAIGPLTASSVASPTAQNVPGVGYPSESGFMPDTTTVLGAPSGASTNFGLTSAGTRIQIAFNNVGTGERLFLPIYVALQNGTPNPASTGLGGYTGGFLQLVGATASTAFTGFSGAFSGNPFPTPNPGLGAAEITTSGGIGTAVYEVVNADPSAIENATIPIGVAYASNTGTNTPPPGTFTSHTSFAPLSTVGTADSSAPIPRFCDDGTTTNLFKVSICQCQLLFPFVTQAPGFDTGIAIANTSLDTYNGVVPQTGTITLYFYGQEAGGAAVPTSLASMTTSSALPAGQVA